MLTECSLDDDYLLRVAHDGGVHEGGEGSHVGVAERGLNQRADARQLHLKKSGNI